MAVSLRASQSGLQIVDQARRKKNWTKRAAAWCTTALVGEAALKKFWSRVPIEAEHFKSICRAVGLENWEEIVDNTSEPVTSPSLPNSTRDWGEAPDIPVFYGRHEELTTLEQWIVSDRCRLVALLGMGGIGKTALSVRLTEQIQDEFEYVIWRSLRHAPPLEDILGNLISFLSNQQESQPDLSRLVNYLRSSRCLVILDEADAILCSPVGYYREGYEEYGELLRWVGEKEHQSCLVLVTQEKPREIALQEGEMRPVRSLQLCSLGEAAQEILREKGLSYKAEEAQKLIQLYGGNPLSLKLVSTTIQNLFRGSVSEYLRHNTIIILNEIRQILEQHYTRLSALEKRIMYELAIHPAPLSISNLTKNTSLTGSEIIEALDSLERRCLIEKATPTPIEKSKVANEVLFTLQPVVMKYVKRIYPEGL
jgi:Cdc6-like AAA superfamily ATPase